LRARHRVILLIEIKCERSIMADVPGHLVTFSRPTAMLKRSSS
jgi:hypothetical protein